MKNTKTKCHDIHGSMSRTGEHSVERTRAYELVNNWRLCTHSGSSVQ